MENFLSALLLSYKQYVKGGKQLNITVTLGVVSCNYLDEELNK